MLNLLGRSLKPSTRQGQGSGGSAGRGGATAGTSPNNAASSLRSLHHSDKQRHASAIATERRQNAEKWLAGCSWSAGARATQAVCVAHHRLCPPGGNGRRPRHSPLAARPMALRPRSSPADPLAVVQVLPCAPCWVCCRRSSQTPPDQAALIDTLRRRGAGLGWRRAAAAIGAFLVRVGEIRSAIEAASDRAIGSARKPEAAGR